MPNMSIELKVSGLEPMKKLLEVLAGNYDALPIAVQAAITELHAKERTCWDRDYFFRMGVNASDIKVIVDGVETKKIQAIYPDEAEVLITGLGLRKFNTLQVINSSTGEPVCGVGNGH